MLPMDQPLKLSGDLEHDGTPDLDVDHALQLARSQRPELPAIDASIRQADAELSATRRRRLPTPSPVADYGLSSNTPGTSPTPPSTPRPLRSAATIPAVRQAPGSERLRPSG